MFLGTFPLPIHCPHRPLPCLSPLLSNLEGQLGGPPQSMKSISCSVRLTRPDGSKLRCCFPGDCGNQVDSLTHTAFHRLTEFEMRTLKATTCLIFSYEDSLIWKTGYISTRRVLKLGSRKPLEERSLYCCNAIYVSW